MENVSCIGISVEDCVVLYYVMNQHSYKILSYKSLLMICKIGFYKSAEGFSKILCCL